MKRMGRRAATLVVGAGGALALALRWILRRSRDRERRADQRRGTARSFEVAESAPELVHLGPPPGAEEERSATRLIAALFVGSILGGLGLAVVYLRGGQVQLEGLLLALSLGGLGGGLAVWGRRLLGREVVTGPREPHGSGRQDVRAVERSFKEMGLSRRTFLVRLLFGAVGALGLAALFPIRSLGPSPGRSLFRTSWSEGARVVSSDGAPIRVGDLDVGSVVTVFPEHHGGEADAVAVLVRVDEESLRLPEGRSAWAPGGNVCYSKICTHAGCPVGLYSVESRQLQCPCHQSAFDVTTGARPVFGPAARPLPQLPLEVDAEGFLRARGDFPEPVGPGFFDREAGSGE